MSELASRCKEVNLDTIRSAHAKAPRTEEELQLANEAWLKVQKDIANGHAGTPIPVADLDLENNLLVDTFGIYEKHAGSDWQVRVINNFRRNTINQYAWMPSKMRYDGFNELHHAFRILKETWLQGLTLGKAEFKSAFKTLPPSKTQQRLCWSLVYNTDIGEFVAVPSHSQASGSLGAVVAWFRTVKMIQAVMQNLFGLVLFSYVDDCFGDYTFLPRNRRTWGPMVFNGVRIHRYRSPWVDTGSREIPSRSSHHAPRVGGGNGPRGFMLAPR